MFSSPSCAKTSLLTKHRPGRVTSLRTGSLKYAKRVRHNSESGHASLLHAKRCWKSTNLDIFNYKVNSKSPLSRSPSRCIASDLTYHCWRGLATIVTTVVGAEEGWWDPWKLRAQPAQPRSTQIYPDLPRSTQHPVWAGQWMSMDFRFSSRTVWDVKQYERDVDCNCKESLPHSQRSRPYILAYLRYLSHFSSRCESHHSTPSHA